MCGVLPCSSLVFTDVVPAIAVMTPQKGRPVRFCRTVVHFRQVLCAQMGFVKATCFARKTRIVLDRDGERVLPQVLHKIQWTHFQVVERFTSVLSHKVPQISVVDTEVLIRNMTWGRLMSFGEVRCTPVHARLLYNFAHTMRMQHHKPPDIFITIQICS